MLHLTTLWSLLTLVKESRHGVRPLVRQLIDHVDSPTLELHIAEITTDFPCLQGLGVNGITRIGHDIVAILDGDETNPFKLNDYYLAAVDDYQRGEVTYPFRDLEPGLHTLNLKAWDVYNNSSTAEIQFVVHDEDEELVIENVLNYPNPFIDYTEFWFN